MTAFNQLTAAQAERLALLLEELGEAQQAIGKILRHGFDEYHPNGGPTNRESLERELGDVGYAIRLLVAGNDLTATHIHKWEKLKAERVARYLHHQPELLR